MTACSTAMVYGAQFDRSPSILKRSVVQGSLALAAIAAVAVGTNTLQTPRQDIRIVVEKAPGPEPVTAAASVPRGSSGWLDGSFSGRTPFLFGQSAPLRAKFQSPTAPVQTAALGTEPLGPSLPPAEAFGPHLPSSAEMAQVAEDVPLPAPRPFGLRPLASGGGRTHVARAAPPQAAPTPVDNRGIFERLFGMSSQPTGPVLAYANPQDGLGGRTSVVPQVPRVAPSVPPVSADGATAIYDISARTVFMPDGTRLEAHSGLGPMMDKPEHVHVRMRGATPPAVYDLTLREKLFHGVQAIRLTPLNSSIFGRNGILAHTYMLGPNGDSNGCVSFRDYNAFLQAFLNGKVKRLVVVASR